MRLCTRLQTVRCESPRVVPANQVPHSWLLSRQGMSPAMRPGSPQPPALAPELRAVGRFRHRNDFRSCSRITVNNLGVTAFVFGAHAAEQ